MARKWPSWTTIACRRSTQLWGGRAARTIDPPPRSPRYSRRQSASRLNTSGSVPKQPHGPAFARKGMSAQEMLDEGLMNGLSRTFRDPYKFACDAYRGYWAHHNSLGPDV